MAENKWVTGVISAYLKGPHNSSYIYLVVRLPPVSSNFFRMTSWDDPLLLDDIQLELVCKTPTRFNVYPPKWNPKLVSFHLGWFSTSMIMGERVMMYTFV